MRPLAAAALLVFVAASAVADVVHLKDGGRVVGRVEDQGDKLRVVTAAGAMTLTKDRVESVEPQETPRDELARRRAALVPGDVAGALALADFAQSVGFPAERGEILAVAASWTPSDGRATTELERWRVFDRPLPENPAAEAALVASVGRDAKLYRTAHWRIAYDGDVAVARRRGEMLEAAWRKFRGLVEKTGLATRPLEDRLECVVYKDHAEWTKATEMPQDRIVGMIGIYIWTSRRILLFDTRTAPQAKLADDSAQQELAALREARAALDGQKADIARIETALKDGTAAKLRDEAGLAQLRDWVAESNRSLAKADDELALRSKDLQRWREDVDRRFADENVASTTHEACHQIAFAFGVSKSGQPLWLIEGLATLFEAQSRTNFVLEAPNENRLRDVKLIWGKKEDGDVRRILTDAVFDVRGREPFAYAESWSLAYFLANKRPRDFARLLAEGSLLSIDEDPRTKRLDDFRRLVTQDVDGFEREWRAYVERL